MDSFVMSPIELMIGVGPLLNNCANPPWLQACSPCQLTILFTNSALHPSNSTLP